MRYLGGIIGLAIGYLMKYRLDRRYVFPPGCGMTRVSAWGRLSCDEHRVALARPCER
jgi:hypothetical protein